MLNDVLHFTYFQLKLILSGTKTFFIVVWFLIDRLLYERLFLTKFVKKNYICKYQLVLNSRIENDK